MAEARLKGEPNGRGQWQAGGSLTSRRRHTCVIPPREGPRIGEPEATVPQPLYVAQMTDPVPERFREVLSTVVDRIAAGDFEGLKRDGIDQRPDADLSLWIRGYGETGATILPLPNEAWAHAQAWQNDEAGVWSVVIDLWTAEEGRSDLSLEATLIEAPSELLVQIDDIHVL